MRKIACIVLFVAVTTVFAWKKEAHFISLPLIEGSGLYSSIMIVRESDAVSTKVPAYSTMTLLGINAALGGFTVLGPQEYYPTLRMIHRFLGFGLTAVGLWMNIAAANDKAVKPLERNVSYVYTGLTTVPIILFSF